MYQLIFLLTFVAAGIVLPTEARAWPGAPEDLYGDPADSDPHWGGGSALVPKKGESDWRAEPGLQMLLGVTGLVVLGMAFLGLRRLAKWVVTRVKIGICRAYWFWLVVYMAACGNIPNLPEPVLPVKAMTPPVPDVKSPVVLEANEFRLIDSTGKTRGALTIVEDQPALILHNPAGGPVAILSVDSEGIPSLTLSDTNGKRRAAVSLYDTGNPWIALFDAAGQERAALELSGGDWPRFYLTDAAGKERVSLDVPEYGPSLSLNSLAGVPRLSLSVSNLPGDADLPTIQLYDNDAFRYRLGLGLDKRGNPFVETIRKNGYVSWGTP